MGIHIFHYLYAPGLRGFGARPASASQRSAKASVPGGSPALPWKRKASTSEPPPAPTKTPTSGRHRRQFL